MPTPIGPEKSWICPSLNTTQSGAPAELLNDISKTVAGGSNVWTPDTERGGAWACTGAQNKYSSNDLTGIPSTESVDYVGTSIWIKNPAGAFASNLSAGRISMFDGQNQIYQTLEYGQVGSGTSWSQSSMTFEVTAFSIKTYVSQQIIIRALPAFGWTQAAFDALFENQWMHLYFEADYARGFAGGSLSGESPFNANSYMRMYLNGYPMTQSTVAIPEGNLSLSNGSSFGAGTAVPSIAFPTSDKFWVDQDMDYDDVRVFADTAPSIAQITKLATARAYEPTPSSTDGLGIETAWMCPSLNPTQTGNPVDLIDGAAITGGTSTVIWESDTDYGGTYKVSNDNALRLTPDIFGDPAGAQERFGYSCWLKYGTNQTNQAGTFQMMASGDGQDSWRVRWGFSKTVLNGDVVTMTLKLNLDFVVMGGSEGAICELRLVYNQGDHTEAEWDALFNDQWNHWYFEVDMARGSSGAGTDYSPFAANPWWKTYFNGVYIGDATAGGFDNNTASGFGGGTPSSYLWPAGDQTSQGTSGISYDDCRYFAQVLPTDAQIAALATERGYSAEAPEPTPNVDSGAWLLPSSETTNVGTANIIDRGLNEIPISIPSVDLPTWTANAEDGGSQMVSNFTGQYNASGTSDQMIGSKQSYSGWLYFPSDWMSVSQSNVQWLGGISQNGANSEVSIGFYPDLWSPSGYALRVKMQAFCNDATGFGGGYFYLQGEDTAPTNDAAGAAAIQATWTGWKHVAFTFDYGKANTIIGDVDCMGEIYIDGIKETSSNLVGQNSGDITTFDLSNCKLTAGVCYDIGALSTAANSFWDDFRYFPHHILTANEVTALAVERGVGYGDEPAVPVGLGDEQNWVCPSLSGSATKDLSLRQNNGVATPTGVIITDNEGDCISLDGTGYVDMPLFTSYTEYLSLSAWFYNETTPADEMQIIGNSNGGGDYQNTQGTIGLAVHDTNGVVRPLATWSNDANDYSASGNNLAPDSGHWYHICAVWDGECRLYLDGTLVQTREYTGPLQTTGVDYPIRIGCYSQQNNSISQPFIGDTDDLRAYNRPLTQAEISYLATSRGIQGTPGVEPPADGFYNPFSSYIFQTIMGKRIR
jgi:hypothetical protein